jgi:hypothetical protein
MKLLNQGFLFAKLKSSLHTMARKKSSKGQTTIYKAYTKNKKSSNTNPTKNPGVNLGAPEG